jgi:hypothetical protein
MQVARVSRIGWTLGEGEGDILKKKMETVNWGKMVFKKISTTTKILNSPPINGSEKRRKKMRAAISLTSRIFGTN